MTAVASCRPSSESCRCRSPSTVSRPSRSIRATVWLTVGPLWGSASAVPGAALVEPLRDARAQRDDPLFLQLEDRPEVHLGGVDEVVHRYSSVSRQVYGGGGSGPVNRTSGPGKVPPTGTA